MFIYKDRLEYAIAPIIFVQYFVKNIKQNFFDWPMLYNPKIILVGQKKI